MEKNPAIIEAQGLSKQYGDVTAVDSSWLFIRERYVKWEDLDQPTF